MIQTWMDSFTRAVQNTLGPRVRFIGLQGSRGRCESTETSDIDVVVILDQFSYTDLKAYEETINALPDRELICGFISGAGELQNWDKADLFQFYHDTTPYLGDLNDIISVPTREDAIHAMHLGACNIYHMCVHNAIHEKSPEILQSLYKSARFVLQAKHYAETGHYLRTKAALFAHLTGTDLEIMEYLAHGDFSESFDQLSQTLMAWAGEIISGDGN